MIQEDIELLFKDLCARLPYDVKIYAKCIDIDTNTEVEKVGVLSMIDTDTSVAFTTDDINCYIYVTIHDVKPYLFPLSSMTKEQYNEWCDLGEKPLDDILTKNANGEKMSTLEHHLLVAKSSIDSVNYCYKNHFDIYGLISLGLATDATNLNIY